MRTPMKQPATVCVLMAAYALTLSTLVAEDTTSSGRQSMPFRDIYLTPPSATVCSYPVHLTTYR